MEKRCDYHIKGHCTYLAKQIREGIQPFLPPKKNYWRLQ